MIRSATARSDFCGLPISHRGCPGVDVLEATAVVYWHGSLPSPLTVLFFDGTESRKANTLVQNLDLHEPDSAQQVELVDERAGRVFFLNVVEHMVPVRLVLQRVRYSPYRWRITPLIAGIELSTRSKIQTDPPGRNARWRVANTASHSWSVRRWCSTAAASTMSN